MAEDQLFPVVGELKLASGATLRGEAKTATLLFAVGGALSTWETSEDFLMTLYRVILREEEPLAFAAFVRANRSTRSHMLKAAMKQHPQRLPSGSTPTIEAILNRLDTLAKTRNEIAHGRLVQWQSSLDGEAPVSGIFLLPSFHDDAWHERSHRYAHNVTTISAFADEVRGLRKTIFELTAQIASSDEKASLAAAS
ncbi:MAG: hypothetical protein QHC89_01865 [Bosea sp. (in: a-proteobacteria)]|nr:hypothetical protein [Bosea sp. (in: a-proteobacteria)]